MNKKQKSNLARTAIFMLQNNYVLNMESFFNNGIFLGSQVPPIGEYNACGTTCCFAGHGPIALKNRKKGEFWDDYVDRVFTGDYYVFDFLFSDEWPNNKKQAAARALIYLRNPEIIESEWDIDSAFLKSYSIAKLITELQKFV